MSSRLSHLVLRGAVAALIVLALGAPLALGQSSTFARLVGTVTDQSGGVIPGVEVTAVNKDTNVVSKAVANERGDYLIDKLQVGTYDVSAEQPGFKKQLFTAVRLQQGQYGRVDFVLQAGQIADTVTVTGLAPIINTDKAEIGTVVEEKKIRDLPLRGRDITKLAFLTTGGTQETQEVGLISGSGAYGYGGGMPAFNGLYSHSNQITLDGVNNEGYINQRMTVSPTPETVQEFKLVTNNYSAEYGKVGGAVISMASKSGTNDFHGDAWYYFRNDTLDANRFFNNRSGRGKLPVDYKIFGGAIGGPIFKNKTFFYGNFEHFIDDQTQAAFSTVPSLARRGGDFSIAGSAGGPVNWTQLYDPYNVVNGQRVAFPGNIIPATRINAFSAKLMQLLPIPAPNQAGAVVNNYAYGSSIFARTNKMMTRIDHHFSSGSTLFGRFNWQETPQTAHTNNVIGAPGMLEGIYQQQLEPAGGFNVSGGWVKPFGAKMVSELNMTGWKSRWLISRSIDQENWEEKLGFDTSSLYPITNPDGSRGPGGMPRVTASGYIPWGPGAVESPLGDWGIDIKYSLAWRKGDHYLKFGFGTMRNRDVHYLYRPQGVGASTFDGFATGQVPLGGVAGTQGDPFADFLLGAPSAFAGNILNPLRDGQGGGRGSFNESHYSAFAQDEWKATKNISLSFGLRWEQPRPPFYNGNPDAGYASGYYYCGMDLSAGRFNPTQWFPESFDITKWAGGNLNNSSIPYKNLSTEGCYSPHWDYFQPRFGLAWKMFGTNRTVLRVGAGSSLDTEFGILRARVLTTPVGVVNVSQIRYAAPTIAFGTFKSLPTQAASAEYTSCYYNQMDWQEGRVYSYNLTIQHELFRGTMVEVGYVGNQTRHLRQVMPLNMGLPLGYDKARLVDGTPVPITGAAVTIPGKNVTLTDNRTQRVYPQLVSNVMMQPDGSMHYDSLQTKVERRFSSGWALISGYTWSKAMALNFNGNWLDTLTGGRYFERNNLSGPMAYDRTHTFYSSLVWELPFFRNGNGFTKRALGGWEFTNITTLTSGQTYPINVGTDLLNTPAGRVNAFPDRLRDGTLSKSERTVDRFFDPSAFGCASASCLTFIPLANMSNFGLGNSFPRPLRGAAVPLTDFSLHKQFHIHESQVFDFRVDMFNAFNHPVFQTPSGTSIASTAAGRVTDTASPRQIMIGFRYSF